MRPFLTTFSKTDYYQCPFFLINWLFFRCVHTFGYIKQQYKSQIKSITCKHAQIVCSNIYYTSIFYWQQSLRNVNSMAATKSTTSKKWYCTLFNKNSLSVTQMTLFMIILKLLDKDLLMCLLKYIISGLFIQVINLDLM